ncbi:MAG: orotate phosphoribosyltransferase [Chloroflexota bacterium]|nr:orotate phosphoribosyltransferase [Chloroflexota bacterium]
MASTDRERLRRMLQERSFISGTFKLSSGQTSSYFFDGKQVVLDPEGAHLAGNAMLELIRERAPDANAVAGPTVGADPIVTAAMLLSAGTEQPLAGLLVRGERKDHGTERVIEGPLQRGMRVVIVDDAATTGGSLVYTTRCLREAGLDLEVVLAIALVDRLAGYEAAMNEIGVPAASVFTLDDFTPPEAASSSLSLDGRGSG